MTLKDLKKLSQQRIINMKNLYEEAGLSVSSMNSRLSVMSGSLSYEEQVALELAAVIQIEQIVTALGIDGSVLANALDITENDIRKGEPAVPCGYLEAGNRPIPVYLPEDKLRPRQAKSGSDKADYWDMDRILNSIVKNNRFEPTERGRRLLQKSEME